jgi:CRISPR/Cas system-associated protein endoribonuclease Cas2
MVNGPRRKRLKLKNDNLVQKEFDILETLLPKKGNCHILEIAYSNFKKEGVLPL